MKQRPTIALCLEYPLGQKGGVEVLLRELILGLSDDFDLVLVSADRELSQCPAPFKYRLKAHLYWNYREASPASARQLIQKLITVEVDLVHFHLGGTYSWETHKFWKSPVYYCRRFRLTYLLTNHRTFPLFEGYNNPARSVLVRALLLPKAWLSRALILLATPLEITVSQHNKRNMQRIYFPWLGRFLHLYHARLSIKDIEQNQVSISPIRDKVILCLGTIGRFKGQLVLARAFARLASRFPEWTLEFIGRGDDIAYQKQLDEVVGLLSNPEQIRFAGVIPNDAAVVERLRHAGVYVQSSLNEGLGLALQEALSFGCPAIGSAVGGIPELIEHGVNGLLVPPGNEEALADALEQLLRDENLRDRLGKAAPREIIRRRMTREDMLSQYVELYHNLLVPKATNKQAAQK